MTKGKKETHGYILTCASSGTQSKQSLLKALILQKLQSETAPPS